MLAIAIAPSRKPHPAPEIDWDGTIRLWGTVIFLVLFIVALVLGMRWHAADERRRRAENARRDAEAAQRRAQEAYAADQRRAWEIQQLAEQETQRRAGEAAAMSARDSAARAQAEARRRADEEAIWRRAADLVGRFGPELGGRIMRREIWVGQTSEQLIESRGHPADIDEKVLKTKTKHVFKYDHQGGAKYGLRITLDNGIVVGWEDKR